MPANQTGIFFMGAPVEAALREFPREFRPTLAKQFEPHFLAILASCALLMGGGALSMSLRPLPEVSEKDILRIQERYAQLILNQPKKEIKKAVKRIDVDMQEKQVTEEEEEPEEKVDREKESVAEKQKRKQASREDRKQRREAVKQQVRTSGIFAAITATGGSGRSSSAVTDLLGAVGVAGDLGDVDISKGTFASKKVDPVELLKRRGERAGGGSIEKQAVGKTAGGRIASAGVVNISSAPPQIKGASAGKGERSYAAINRTVTRYQGRLKRVYETWLKRDPNLSGKLKVKFTIMPNGTVTKVSVVASTTNNPDFDRRVVSHICRWKFPVATGAGEVEVVFPFVFSGSS